MERGFRGLVKRYVKGRFLFFSPLNYTSLRKKTCLAVYLSLTKDGVLCVIFEFFMINNSWQGAASSNWNYNLDNRHWFSPERSSHTGHSVKRLCIASIYPAFSALKFQSRSLRRGILNPTLDHFKYKITQTWKVFKSNGRLSMAALVCHRSDYKNKPHWSRDNRNINQKKHLFTKPSSIFTSFLLIWLSFQQCVIHTYELEIFQRSLLHDILRQGNFPD